MTSRVITVQCGGPGLKIPNKRQLIKSGVEFTVFDNKHNNYTPRQAYHLTSLTDEDILIYTHDDLIIHDPQWHDRLVDSMFSDAGKPHNGIIAVGFGGATKLGHPYLYKRPYRLPDMARSGYASNQIDAETHGERFTGVRQVAVLDAFIMAVRRDFLVSVGGWPEQLSHHGLDLWLACMAARHGKQIYMTGVDCNHLGGRTSTKGIYADATWLQGGTLDSDHQAPHLWLYESFRDVLPIDVTKF